MRGTIVLSVSQLLPHKRIELLLEAAYILEHHIHADVTIVVVGAARSPRYQKVLNQLTRQLSLSGVRLWGEVSDATLAELYGRPVPS